MAAVRCGGAWGLLLAGAVLSRPLGSARGQSPPRVYGDVTASADRIAFTLAGQLWDVPRGGGTARRLSATPDDHSHPLYSPDGNQLAYERANGLWVMPAGGGDSRRLTWHPKGGTPRAWTPDGRSILYVSSRDGDGNQRGYTVPVAGGPTPADAAAGRDPQLATAIDVAMQALGRWRPAVKKRPAMPLHPPREP